MKKNNLPFYLVVLLVILIIVSFYLGAKNINAQEVIISSDVALELSLSYSIDDGLMGGAVTPPEKVYGKIMTYNEAIQFVFNKPIDVNTKQYEKRNIVVWLVVLEGKFIEHIPASAGGDIPETEVIHNQMIIIFNGKTGEIMRRILPSTQTQVSVDNLLVLEKTDSNIIDLPTLAPISTEKPYPTLTPIPTETTETIEVFTETVASTPTETITSTP